MLAIEAIQRRKKNHWTQIIKDYTWSITESYKFMVFTFEIITIVHWILISIDVTKLYKKLVVSPPPLCHVLCTNEILYYVCAWT